MIDKRKERFGLSWHGKSDCFQTIQNPSLATLLPCEAESVDWGPTENLIIEGDNLEVLKLLQKSYLGRVKMIFIDPPYNTGKDFIYPDDYSEDLQTYLQYTGQIDSEGRRFSTNTDTSGRFHSKWLNMMYPRLYLARNLLSDDGAIFVTIDDVEVSNLRAVMNEVYGEENFVAQIEWEKRYTRSNNTNEFTSVIDHILLYRKTEAFAPNLLPRGEEADSRYSNPDNDPRGPWKPIPFLNPLSPEQRPNLAYEIVQPKSGKVIRPTRKAWRSEKAVFDRLSRDGRIWWGKEGVSEVPNVKRFLSEVKQGITPINFWSHEFADHTDSANKEISELLGDKVFDTPKPKRLVRRMLELTTEPSAGDIVLDFFAGSGTTAHAVLEKNLEDGGNRRFLLVQLPERLDVDDPDQRIAATFCASIGKPSNVAEITKERVRRAITALESQERGKLGSFESRRPDLGFRGYKLAESNFRPWPASTPKDERGLQTRITEHVHHIVKGRSSGDILSEILLKSGFPLTAAAEAVLLEGRTVYSVSGGTMLICLERELTLQAIRAMAERGPERVVLLDDGFEGNDQLKANAVQTFRTKGITSFKTV